MYYYCILNGIPKMKDKIKKLTNLKSFNVNVLTNGKFKEVQTYSKFVYKG